MKVDWLRERPSKAAGSVLRRVAGQLLLAGTIAWAVGLLAAPFVLTHGGFTPAAVRAAVVTYALGGIVCHQRPDRSFDAWGLPLPVCARCTGLYAAAPLGVLLGLTLGTSPWRRSRRALFDQARLDLMVAALPTAMTVGAEYVLGVPIAGWLRAVTAAPLALAVGWLVVAALRGELTPEAGVH